MAAAKATDELKKFANSDTFGYIKFNENNDPITGIYLGYVVEDDTFNPGKQRVAYSLQIDGQNQILTSGSKRLAKEFVEKDPKANSFIKITRNLGETQYDTTFEVEVSEIPF